MCSCIVPVIESDSEIPLSFSIQKTTAPMRDASLFLRQQLFLLFHKSLNITSSGKLLILSGGQRRGSNRRRQPFQGWLPSNNAKYGSHFRFVASCRSDPKAIEMTVSIFVSTLVQNQSQSGNICSNEQSRRYSLVCSCMVTYSKQ
jgi:hypothetical protein